jgi:Acylphosphatase
MILSFLLKGKVQGVKMRRYIESAGQHFGVAGYVINIDENDSDDPGAVFGQAWLVERGETADSCRSSSSDNCKLQEVTADLESFETWIRGDWIPRSYTNIKPTPIGTAYPEKAYVEHYAVSKGDGGQPQNFKGKFNQFTMVREDEYALVISKATTEFRRTLSSAMAGEIHSDAVVTGSWPQKVHD